MVHTKVGLLSQNTPWTSGKRLVICRTIDMHYEQSQMVTEFMLLVE